MSLTKVGSGSLTIDSAATYSGGTIISGGSLLLGTNGSLSDSTAVSLTSTGTAFNISAISGSSETIASLAGVTGSSLNLGGKTLIFGDANNTEFAGDITGVGGTLTKVGLGKTTLSGTNTFSGPINLVGGTLLIGGSGALPSGSAINLSSGATLQTGSFTTTTGPLSLGLGDGIIDMNTSSSSITFLDTGSWVGGLSIWNYNGGIWDAGSSDKIFLTSNTGSINPLISVKFYSDNGGNQIGTGGTFVSGSNGQLVPVPEPTPLCAGLVLLTLATASRRRSAGMR